MRENNKNNETSRLIKHFDFKSKLAWYMLWKLLPRYFDPLIIVFNSASNQKYLELHERKRTLVDWFWSFDQANIKIWSIPWLIWFMNSKWFNFTQFITSGRHWICGSHFGCKLWPWILLCHKESILFQWFCNTTPLENSMFSERHLNLVKWCDDAGCSFELWSAAMSSGYYPTVTE